MTEAGRTVIAELPVPSRLGTPESAAFEEMVAVLNGISVELWHNEDFVVTAEAELAGFRAQEFRELMAFVAVVDGAIVGRVLAIFPLEENAVTATLLVHVVPALRRRGIGSALLAKGEDLVADGGRTVISAYTEHPAAALRAAAAHDRGRVHAPIGRDGLPAGSPEVAFALRHGYRLGQVERSSELALPLAAERRGRLVADARAQSADYRTITWWRTVPDDLIADFAALKARMTVDVPQSGIELDTETWTTARVREHENELIARGEPLLVTAAQHLPSGTLVGYTEIAVPEDGDKAEQYDTLVAPAHRGHRLGTLLKLENLDRLAEVAPHIRRLLTWNAAENTPMLAVNDAFGFRQHGLTGTWQKSLP